MGRQPFGLLAQVRRSLRALNEAIEKGCRGAGLTVQQQAFLLALAAHEEDLVPLADIRSELRMDQPTASELLARLHRSGLIRRSQARDRRALLVALSSRGDAKLRDSIRRTRGELVAAKARGELDALSESLAEYFKFHTRGKAATRLENNDRMRRRRPASSNLA